MPLASADVLRVTARMKNEVVGDVDNVYFLRATAQTADSDATILTAIGTWLDTIYSAVNSMSDENDPYDYKVDVVQRVGGKIEILRTLGTKTWSLTTPPAGSADAMPQGCTAVINFRTGTPQVPGRKYVGTWTDTAAAGDTFTGAVVTALTTAAGYMLANVSLTGAVLTPGVVSLVRDGGLGDGFYQLLEAVVNPIVGYMRSRKRNRGS